VISVVYHLSIKGAKSFAGSFVSEAWASMVHTPWKQEW